MIEKKPSNEDLPVANGKERFEKNILKKMNSLMEFLIHPEDDDNEYVITITKKPR